MATPAPIDRTLEQAEADLADYQCQTPDCPNTYRVVSFMVGDSTAQFHCYACWMAWNAKIIELLGEQGLI